MGSEIGEFAVGAKPADERVSGTHAHAYTFSMIPDVATVALIGLLVRFAGARARSAGEFVRGTWVGLDVPCKQVWCKEVLEGGFWLFLLERGQFVGFFCKFGDGNLKGFASLQRRKRRWQQRPRWEEKVLGWN